MLGTYKEIYLIMKHTKSIDMNLKEVSQEIRELIDKRQKELRLSFVEKKHIYYMVDKTGKIKSNFPSVSKIVKNFHEEFDSYGMSLKMSKGNVEEQTKLLAEWKTLGNLSTNMGTRIHYMLEKELIGRYDNYKEVREI